MDDRIERDRLAYEERYWSEQDRKDASRRRRWQSTVVQNQQKERQVNHVKKEKKAQEVEEVYQK